MTVSNLEQKFCLIPANVKEAYLVYVLNSTKLKKNQQLIVFTSTCRNCHFLAMLLTELGFEVALIHSQLSQKKRIANLAKFKS
jgi:ATP-dependent RNA helicase DDX49/DBP8